MTPYVLRLIAVPAEARLVRGAVKVRRYESMWAVGTNGCQGTPWSEELDGKELHGAACGEYDREPRGSSLSCTRSQHNPSRHLRFGIMLVLKRVMVLHDLLYSCTTLEEYLASNFVLSSRTVLLLYGVVFDFYILTPHIASLLVASAHSGKLVPKNSCIGPSYLNGALDSGRVLSLLAVLPLVRGVSFRKWIPFPSSETAKSV